MRIETKRFGTIEIDENAIIHFPKGLIGFESCHRFALIKNEDFDPFCWLVSLDEVELSLPILNPNLVNPNFDLSLSKSLTDHRFMNNGFSDIFCVVNIEGELGRFTINLKSPIFVNFDERMGKQLILDSDELMVDQPVW